MSDIKTRKATTEEQLKAIYKSLKTTATFLCLGYFLGCITAFWVADMLPNPFLGLLALIGPFVLAVAPLLRYSGMGIGKLLKPDYEMVTVDSGGRVISTDSGMQSLQTNFFVILFLIALGCVIQTIRVFYLGTKYIRLQRQANPKPVFNKSAVSIMFGVLIVLFFSPVVVNGAALLGGLATASSYLSNSQKEFPPAKIRAMFEETQTQLLSNSFSYEVGSRKYGNLRKDVAYNAAVRYNHANDTTVIRITLLDENVFSGEVLPGTYTFKGDNLTNSDIEVSRTLSPKGLEEITNLIPVNFFFKPFHNAVDDQLYASNVTGNNKKPTGEIILQVLKSASKSKGIAAVWENIPPVVTFIVRAEGNKYIIKTVRIENFINANDMHGRDNFQINYNQ